MSYFTAIRERCQGEHEENNGNSLAITEHRANGHPLLCLLSEGQFPTPVSQIGWRRLLLGHGDEVGVFFHLCCKNTSRRIGEGRQGRESWKLFLGFLYSSINPFIYIQHSSKGNQQIQNTMAMINIISAAFYCNSLKCSDLIAVISATLSSVGTRIPHSIMVHHYHLLD